jgi:prepilin-type N-terminal cleavage/methylation domain-containing protein
MNNLKKIIKKAFTLAEVLITLTIIGIVASLTIPTLVNNVNNAGTVAQVKKYQGVLQGALTTMMAQKGIGDLAGIYSDSNAFANDFKTQLNIVKDCGSVAGQGCFAKNTMYKSLNGKNDVIYDNDYKYKLVLSDGASISILIWSPLCNDSSIPSNPTTCGNIYIDINAGNGPNQDGRDLFLWHIMKNGAIIPNGVGGDVWGGCDPNSVDVTPGAVGTPGIGLGCAAKVLQEGAVNY